MRSLGAKMSIRWEKFPAEKKNFQRKNFPAEKNPAEENEPLGLSLRYRKKRKEKRENSPSSPGGYNTFFFLFQSLKWPCYGGAKVKRKSSIFAPRIRSTNALI